MKLDNTNDKVTTHSIQKRSMKEQSQQDKVFSQPLDKISPFQFNETVASVFDDMISRSVPLYHEVQEITTRIAARFVQPGSSVYDLGCSTATSLIALCESLDDASVSFVGVDNSVPMLERAREKIVVEKLQDRISLVHDSIQSATLSNASLVLLHYTLQFLPPEDRPLLLKRIFDSLHIGGALLLTEKVSHPHPKMDKLLIDLYYDFKRYNGYSELEISQKREALENVLVPLSVEENLMLLNQAGFTCTDVIYKALNFTSILALKVL